MFYSQFLLAKKGPLGKIWLAAHWDKRLTRAHIFATDIKQSVEALRKPAAPLSLRVSGHLLLGLSRIYARKVQYLYVDSTEAFVKLKAAARTHAHTHTLDIDVEEGGGAGARIDMDPLDLAINGGGAGLDMSFGLDGFPGLSGLGMGGSTLPAAHVGDDEWAVVGGTGAGVPLNQSMSGAGLPQEVADGDVFDATGRSSALFASGARSSAGRSHVSDIEVARAADRDTPVLRGAGRGSNITDDDDDNRSIVSDMDDDARRRKRGARSSIMPTLAPDAIGQERRGLQAGLSAFGDVGGVDNALLAEMMGLSGINAFPEIDNGAGDVEIGGAYEGDAVADEPLAFSETFDGKDTSQTPSRAYLTMEDVMGEPSHLATAADLEAAESSAAAAAAKAVKAAKRERRAKARAVVAKADEETVLKGDLIKGWIADTSSIVRPRQTPAARREHVSSMLRTAVEKSARAAVNAVSSQAQRIATGEAAPAPTFSPSMLAAALLNIALDDAPSEHGPEGDSLLRVPSALDIEAQQLSLFRSPFGGIQAPTTAVMLAEHSSRKAVYPREEEAPEPEAPPAAGKKRAAAEVSHAADDYVPPFERIDNGAGDVEIGGDYDYGGDLGLELDGVDANLAGSGIDTHGNVIAFHDDDLGAAAGLDHEDVGRPHSGDRSGGPERLSMSRSSQPPLSADRSHPSSASVASGAAGGEAPEPTSWAADVSQVTSTYVDRSKWTPATVAMLRVLAEEMSGPSRAGRKRKDPSDRGDLSDVSSGKGSTSDPISFLSMAPGASREAVAASFLQLLILKSWDIIDVQQPKSYGDIHVVRTSRFAEVLAEDAATAARMP